MSIPHTHANLRLLVYILVGLGMLASVISVASSIILYQSFSTDPGGKILYSGYGLFFAGLVLVMLPVAFLLYRSEHVMLSWLALAAWVIVLVFEISSHWGFTADAQRARDTEAAKGSQETLLAQRDYNEANTRAAALEASAGAAPAAQAEVTRLQGEIAAVLLAAAAHMNPDCSPKKDGKGNPFTSRAAEHCAKLRPLQANLAKQEAIVAAAAGYEPAKKAKAEAEARLQTAAKPGAAISDNTHPLFGSQAQIFNSDPVKMQNRFLFFTATCFSVLSAFVWVVVAALSTTPASERAEEEAPLQIKAEVEESPPPQEPEPARVFEFLELDDLTEQEEPPANFRLTHSRRTP